MTNTDYQAEIDLFIGEFFSAFDNRHHRAPSLHALTRFFTEKAVIARSTGSQCEVYTVEEFAKPRVELLSNGELIDFYEWEDSAATQIDQCVAMRVSRYSKLGLLNGLQYAGSGSKYFQLAKFNDAWLIVALTWVDDNG
jgi:ribosomal-protein-serine acetyltransferase